MFGDRASTFTKRCVVGAVLVTGLAACSSATGSNHSLSRQAGAGASIASSRHTDDLHDDLQDDLGTGERSVAGWVTREFTLPDVFDIDVRGGSIWATVPDRERLVRLDRRTGERLASIRVGTGTLDGIGLSFVTASRGAVWVTVPQDDLLVRVDPRTNTVVDRIPVGDDPWGLDADQSAVWVAVHHGTRHGQAVRVDPRTDRVVARVPLGPATQGPGHVTLAPDAVWVGVDGEHAVARIDPRTNRVVATIPVDGGCGGLDSGEAVWVSARICGSHVARIDPATNSVTTQVELPGYSLGLEILRGSVWVANADGGHGALIRIEERTGVVLGRIDLDHIVGTLAVSDALYAAGAGEIIRVEPVKESR